MGDTQGEAECLHNLGAAHFNDGRAEQVEYVYSQDFLFNAFVQVDNCRNLPHKLFDICFDYYW